MTLTDSQLDNVIFFIGTIIAVLKAIEVYYRKQQTAAAKDLAGSQAATAKALVALKKIP